jgi:hypothetical protein
VSAPTRLWRASSNRCRVPGAAPCCSRGMRPEGRPPSRAESDGAPVSYPALAHLKFSFAGEGTRGGGDAEVLRLRGKAEGIVPGGNRESSRWSSEATPPERGPQNSPPRRGVAEDLFPGWSLARPAGVPSRGDGLPAVSLRSTVGYFLGCLRHRIELSVRGFLALF